MRSTAWSVNHSSTQAEKEIPIVKGGYLPMLIGDWQSPLLQILQGNLTVKPAGCFLQLAILKPTNLFSRQKNPHGFLTEPPSSHLHCPMASYPSPEPRHHTHEEWRIPRDKTIFLIFLQPCHHQYHEFSSPDAQLNGQGSFLTEPPSSHLCCPMASYWSPKPIHHTPQRMKNTKGYNDIPNISAALSPPVPWIF